MAPYFGASTVVWANTIAVVLVALSLGSWAGGRIADRHPTESALRRWVLAAAGMLALVPLVARPFLDVTSDAAGAGGAGEFGGSLAGALVLLGPPLVVLGAVAPWAIRLTVAHVGEAGTATGRLFAIETAGALLGTFLSALLLIPLVGTQRTFLAFALVLAVAAAAAGLPRRFLLAPAAVGALLALPPP